MNFWNFEEDHSRGYYDPPLLQRTSPRGGGLLLKSLFFFVVQLLKLAGSLILCGWRVLALLLRLIAGVKMRKERRAV